MKKLIITISFLFLSELCSAQITMDSVKVFGDSTGFDSVFVRYTSKNQKITNFLYITYNDVCGTTQSNIIFKGCSTLTNVQKDTILKFGFWGVSSNFLRLYTIWDTSTTCSYPSMHVTTDSYFFNNCNPTSLSETKNFENKLNLYPNPAQEFFKVQTSEGIIIDQVEILDVQGRLVNAISNQNNNPIDVSSLDNGIYYVKFISSEGFAVKKIVVSK